MRFDVSYELTDEMIDRAMRRFILHHLNRRIAAVVALYVVLLILLCAMESTGWICGLFAGAIFLLFLLVVIAYFVRGHETRAAMRKLRHRQIRWELSEEGLTRHSALGVANWPLSFFDTVVVKSDFVFFLLRRQLHAFMPTTALSPEALTFLRERIVAHGGRVVQSSA